MKLDRVTLAITGASGVQYGLRLLECLVAADIQVLVLISRAAQVVIATETELKMPGATAEQEQFLTDLYNAKDGQIRVFGREQWMSPVASGSGAPSAMVVCPCSTGSLSAIACGASNNLIERAADVALKEMVGKGITDINIISPAFAVDCLETLEEVTYELGDEFRASGGKTYDYIAALNDSDDQVGLFCELIRQNSLQWSQVQ